MDIAVSNTFCDYVDAPMKALKISYGHSPKIYRNYAANLAGMYLMNYFCNGKRASVVLFDPEYPAIADKS